MINLGVVAAIRAVGVRGDPCGAMCWNGSPTHCTTRVTTYSYCTYCCHNTETDRQDFKFSVFKNFLKNFKLLSNFNEVQTYSLMMIC